MKLQKLMAISSAILGLTYSSVFILSLFNFENGYPPAVSKIQGILFGVFGVHFFISLSIWLFKSSK